MAPLADNTIPVQFIGPPPLPPAATHQLMMTWQAGAAVIALCCAIFLSYRIFHNITRRRELQERARHERPLPTGLTGRIDPETPGHPSPTAATTTASTASDPTPRSQGEGDHR